MVHTNRGNRVYARWQSTIDMPDGTRFNCKTTAVNTSSIYFEVPIYIPTKTHLVANMLVLENRKLINLRVEGKVKTAFLASQGEYFIASLNIDNADSNTKSYIANHFKNLNRFKPKFN